MPFLRQGAVSAPIVIPAAQSIRVAALSGSTASINIPTGLPGGPVSTVIDGSVLFGPFPVGATVIVGCIIGECEFVIGATPVLTDTLYNSASVAITGGAISGAVINGGSVSMIGGELRFGAAGGLASVLTDSSGVPGNATQNSVSHGRAAFAAAGMSVVITNSLCAANSTVLVSLGGADATLTSVRVTTAAGSFTVNGNAAATGITPFDYVLVRN